jgi:hypothetical protein
MAALAEPHVFFARRPAAERAADARSAGVLLVLNVAVWSNGGSIGRWTRLFGSLNSLVFGKSAPIPPDHAHFFAA